MIILWLMEVLLTFLEWLVDLFPQADLSFLDGFTTGVGPIIGVMQGLNDYLPVGEIIALTGVYGTAYIALHGGGLARKAWSLISGGGGA